MPREFKGVALATAEDTVVAENRGHYMQDSHGAELRAGGRPDVAPCSVGDRAHVRVVFPAISNQSCEAAAIKFNSENILVALKRTRVRPHHLPAARQWNAS